MKKAQRAYINSKLDWLVKKSNPLNWWGFTLSIVILCLAPTSHAVEIGGYQKMKYSVFASGLNVVEASLSIDTREKDKYSMYVEVETRGLLGRLVPWSGTFESNGWANIDKDGTTTFRPELHKSTAIWRKKNKIKEYKYNKDGTFSGLYVTEHYRERERKEVETDLTDHTTDIMAATLNALENISQGQSCDSESEVFDGKRRFKMMFKKKKDTELTSSRYNIYNGMAIECVVEVVPIAGAWHKKPRGWFSIQEQGRERGKMPTIWFGIIDDNLPAIPIKVLVKTGYGALVMHLVDYDNGSNKFTLHK